MNLSFSTRGWGDMSWEALLEVAIDMKFTGIEVYNLFKFPELTDRGGPFHKHKIAATVRQLRDLKLKIPCLDTSLDLSESAENAEILKSVMTAAHDLRVPYVVCWASHNEEALIRAGMDSSEAQRRTNTALGYPPEYSPGQESTF